MSDIIHLLPDSIANQIAAGEVIQRPASVVKELMENSLDAGATSVCVVVKNAGKTHIQVSDNGKGMSHTDVRMAFERHATSKISTPDDLFHLKTMGFRGEALASIAAVAAVEVRTKQKNADFGTFIEIAASNIVKHIATTCSEGTTFLVKNLFFNIPARRKFLKADETELRNIIIEFQRIALANSQIEFELFNGSDRIYELKSGNFKQRISAIFSRQNKNFANQLIAINTTTSLVNIYGFVGKPQNASKKPNQFFFVNGRFMRHPYFNRAVLNAYENMLPHDYQPNYFICFEVNPENIDVNIHPTKTEIKFEDEKDIWAVIIACVREGLGKFDFSPSIDFDTDGKIDIPIYNKNTGNLQMPQTSYNANYNPFNNYNSKHYFKQSSSAKNWEILYEQKHKIDDNYDNINEQQIFVNNNESGNFYRHKDKFLITSIKSGLMIIDCQRALERITYEKILLQLQQQKCAVQKVLFPDTLELTVDEKLLFDEMFNDLIALGFEFEHTDKNAFLITGIPSLLIETPSITELLHNIIAFVSENSIEKEIYEKIATQMAKNYAKCYVSKFNDEETDILANNLFQCSNPNFTTNGEKIIAIIADEEIFKKFIN